MDDQPRFQLTVHKTRKVKPRGKQGTNDLYAVVIFGKEKHKTSVVERCIDAVWNQNCYLTLMGNEYGTLKIKVCHRNFLLTTDESIGQVEILLKHFTFYESPKTSWFKLTNKAAKNEAEVLLTLTYLAVLPSIIITDSSNNTFKNFAKKLIISGDSKRKRKKSLCELTKKDCEKDKELSKLQIMPNDLKCLYWDSNNGEKNSEILRKKRPSAKQQDDMVNVKLARRHSIALSNSKKSQELSLSAEVDVRASVYELKSNIASYPNTPTDFHYQPTLPNDKTQTACDSESNNSSIRDSSFQTSSKSSLTKASQVLTDEENYTNEIHSTLSDSLSKNSNEIQTKQISSIGKQDLEEKNALDSDNANKNIDFIKKIGERMVQNIAELNSRNLLYHHFKEFTKEELVQLVLDQREWIKARELYILEIEEYQKKLLLKVLDQSIKGNQIKKGIRNSIVEEINLGVNQVLQRRRGNSEKDNKNKSEPKSLAKKWFGSFFKPS